MMRQLRKVVGAAVLSTVVSGAAVAADPESCATVRMADPGWTDITSTTRSPACCWRGSVMSRRCS